ncbi:RNA-directed DNA polymerase from mobile element jockey [Portunus trituberculatus]|uniref:RNA-directed DNA polymerase from mobile element jockey n=1 Tax=Portunus trituberculatus TaxID=210409 RepID=A0A5B7ED37_PORTR|nr:RNA-directed DNA polymerase from mobile element jockey [Portunus trituberculatus]
MGLRTKATLRGKLCSDQGKSAADLHLLLTSELSGALEQGRTTAVVALDIEETFDHVWHSALVTKLLAAGIDGELLPLLQVYLKDRHLRVTVGGRESEMQPIQAGVPQGSCFSPSALEHLHKLFFAPHPQYKDVHERPHSDPEPQPGGDVCRHGSAQHKPETHYRLGQHVVGEICTTQLLHVTRSSVPLNLDFNGRTLAPQDEMEELGVTYDCRLTFKSRIERLVREASGKLASLRRMSWLLDNRGLEVLYKAQIRSSLEYACLAWGGAAQEAPCSPRQGTRAELGMSHDCNLNNSVGTWRDSPLCLRCK